MRKEINFYIRSNIGDMLHEFKVDVSGNKGDFKHVLFYTIVGILETSKFKYFNVFVDNISMCYVGRASEGIRVFEFKVGDSKYRKATLIDSVSHFIELLNV